MVDDSSAISPALCSVGDLGRRPSRGSNVDREERLLLKEARILRQRKWYHPMRALFRKL
jgi:hypothetical protein